MTVPASTHRRCRRCRELLHRERFAPHHAVCRACNNADNIVNRRHKRRTNPAVRARERAWDRSRRAREREERRGDIRWRKDWARLTVVRLHDSGWSYARIAEAAGLNRQTVMRWAHGRGTHLKVGTFERFWDWARTLDAGEDMAA